jgi:MFS family permease
LAGGAAAAALSLVLLILGTGLGFAIVSPWSSQGVSATTFGVSTIIWITFTQLAASAVGGYLAGRLRSKWADTARDEVYFRDTAHGFLAWCVASLGTAAVLTSVIGAIVSGGVQAGATAVGAAASSAAGAGSTAVLPLNQNQSGGAQGANGAQGPNAGAQGGANAVGYFVDSLFRSNVASAGAPGPAGQAQPNSGNPEGPATSQAQRNAADSAEVVRIFVNALRTGSLPDDDARYVGRLVAQRTDLSENDATQRVRDTFARVQGTIHDAEDAARKTADDARKAGAYASLWLVVSMLVGAFVASLMATYGGRLRDL